MHSEKETETREKWQFHLQFLKLKNIPQNTPYEKPGVDMNFQPLVFLLHFKILIGSLTTSEVKSSHKKHY